MATLAILIAAACHIGVTRFFYSLFKPVNRESLYAGGLLQALRDAPLAFLAHFISYPPTSAPWDFSDSTAS